MKSNYPFSTFSLLFLLLASACASSVVPTQSSSVLATTTLPAVEPTTTPTLAPTTLPTVELTTTPTLAPTTAAPTTAPTAAPTSTPTSKTPISAAPGSVDPFVGKWSGTMKNKSDPNLRWYATITIPAGCTIGKICGNVFDGTFNCKIDITLVSITDSVFTYNDSTGSSTCGVSGIAGTLTLQADGTVIHKFTGGYSGILSKN